MSEEMVNLSVYDTLSLTRDNPITDRLKTLPRPPFFMNPAEALPVWLTRPLDAKMPMMGIPRRFRAPYTRGTLGEKLVHSLDPNHFVIYDPHGYDIRYDYAPLHDKHLKTFFTKPVTQALVEKTNEVRNGRTVCSLKEYNDYRKYIHKIQLHYVTQEIQNEENLRKEEIGVDNFMNKAKKEAKEKWNQRLKSYLKEKKTQGEKEEQRKKREKCRQRLKRVEERSAVVKKRFEEERALRSIKWEAYRKKMKDYFKELKDDQRRLGIASRKKWLIEAVLNNRRKEDNLEENRLKRDKELEINWERRKKGQMIKLQKDKLCLEQYNKCMEVMRERRQRGYNKDLEMEEMLTLPGMDNLSDLRVADTLVDNYSQEFTKAIRGVKFFVNPRAKQYTLEKALRKYIKHTESPKERLRKAFIVKPIKEAMDLIIRRTVTHYAFFKSYEIIKEMLKGAEHTADKIKNSQPLRKLLLVEYQKYGPRSSTPYNTLLHFGEDGLSHCICDHRVISKDRLWWPCTLCRQNKPDDALELNDEVDDGEEFFGSVSFSSEEDSLEDESDDSDEGGGGNRVEGFEVEPHRSEDHAVEVKVERVPASGARKHDVKDSRHEEEGKGGKMVAFPEDGGLQKLASVSLDAPTRELSEAEKRVHRDRRSSRKRSSRASKKQKKRRKPSKFSRHSKDSSKKNFSKKPKRSLDRKDPHLKMVTEVHRKSEAVQDLVDDIVKSKEFSLTKQETSVPLREPQELEKQKQVNEQESPTHITKQTLDTTDQCKCQCGSTHSLNTGVSHMSITSDNRLHFVKSGDRDPTRTPRKPNTSLQTSKGFVQGKCQCWKRIAIASSLPSSVDTIRASPSRKRVPSRKQNKPKTRWVGKINGEGVMDAEKSIGLDIDQPSLAESIDTEEGEVLVAICKCGAKDCVKKIVIENEEEFDRMVKSLQDIEETKKIFLDKEIIKKCQCEKCRENSQEISLSKELRSLSSRSSVRLARTHCRCLKKNLGAFEYMKADKLAYMRKIVGAGKKTKREDVGTLTGKGLGETEKSVEVPSRKKTYRKKYREPRIPSKNKKISTVPELFRRPFPDPDIQKLYVDDEGFLYSLDRRARKTNIAYVGDNLKIDQNGNKYFQDNIGNRYVVDITGRVYAVGKSDSKYSLFCEKGMLTVNPLPKKDAILAKVRPSVLCAVPEGADEVQSEVGEEETSKDDVEPNRYEFIDETRSDEAPSKSQLVQPSLTPEETGGKDYSGDAIKRRSSKDKPTLKLAQSLERIEDLTLNDVAQLTGRVPPPRMPIKRPLNSLVNEVPRHKSIDQLFIQRNKFEQCARIIARRLLLYSYCKATRLKELGMDKLEEFNQDKDKNRMKIDHLIKALTQITAHYPLKLVTSRRLSVYIDALAKSMLYPDEYSLFGDVADDSEMRKRLDKQADKATEGTSMTVSGRPLKSPLAKLFEEASESQGPIDTTGILSKSFMAIIGRTPKDKTPALKSSQDDLKEPDEEEEEEEDFAENK